MVCCFGTSTLVAAVLTMHLCVSSWLWVNSLAPRKFEWNFRYVIFKRILVIDGWGISCEIALIWMSLDSTDDQSALVQGMAWCRQATSHYLNQCWPRSLPPYGVTRPQWVNTLSHILSHHWFEGNCWCHQAISHYLDQRQPSCMKTTKG